jgi:hypothetical protein
LGAANRARDQPRGGNQLDLPNAKTHITGDRIVGKSCAQLPHGPAARYSEGVVDE